MRSGLDMLNGITRDDWEMAMETDPDAYEDKPPTSRGQATHRL